MYELTTNSEEATREIAKFIAPHLNRGDVITLEGELGVGKTVFVKGLAEGLEIKRAVTSPTFTIVKEYKGKLPLYHMDAYRLEHSDEDIGFDEYFYGDGISVVEWASFIEEYLPEKRLMIHINRIDSTNRLLRFNPVGEHFKTIVKQIEKRYKK